jgi:APA family basic amino acid/polyamine antiporter
MYKIFKTKSITELMTDTPESEGKLKRTLSAVNLTTLGIGAIIGAGIFVLTGQAAAEHAGPAIVISFIISGFACALAGLCYAEFASMIPIAGSAYTYAYATLGELIAWIIGWDLIIEYLFAASTVAVGWSGYVVSFLHDLGIHIPASISKAPYDYDDKLGWVSSGSIINLPAILIIGLISILLAIGIKESAKFNNIIVIIKLTVILLFIGFGIAYINTENWTPFIPENTGKPENFGFSGVVAGASVIFFAYIGFDAVSTAAQEAKNPQRDMPIGILASLAISTVLYIAVALVMTGLVSYKTLNVPDPIAVAVNAIGSNLTWLKKLIKLGAIAGLSSVVLVMLMGQSRIFFSISKDGLLPKKFHQLHPKFKTPVFSTIITGVFAMMIAGIFPIGLLGKLVSIGTLFAFFIVCIGILVLRYKRPELHRPFKTPIVHVVSILGALVVLYLMFALGKDTWIRLFSWMGIGMLIYYFYGRKNSLVNNRR